MGRSGVGKTTLAQALCDREGYKQLSSYTTRPPRVPNEQGHTFIASDSYKDIDDLKAQYPNRVAETMFDGNFYFATAEQVEQCDIYVIDPAGIRTFKERYKGKKKVKVVLLKCMKFLAERRMAARGDTEEMIQARIANDDVMFADADELADVVFYNDVFETTYQQLNEYIKTGKVRE